MNFKVLIIFLFCPSIILGQNLVPNGDFEDTAKWVTPLYLPSDWVAATREGWNYFNPINGTIPQNTAYSSPINFAGVQNARSGQSYIGILMYHLNTFRRNARREYAHVQLKRPLKQDSTYCLQIHVSLADSSKFGSKGQLAVYFSSNKINMNTTENLPFVPQLFVSPNQFITDKSNWLEFNLEYKATGLEKYITLGNFNDTNYIDTINTGVGYDLTFYYIDDVWLSHCDSLPDTTIGIVEKDLGKQLDLYPNPTQDILQVELKNKAIQIQEVQVFNLLGQRQPIGTIEPQQNKLVLQTAALKSGIYLLQIKTAEGTVVKKFVKE